MHPGLAALPAARRVLMLGGGDGLALREMLRYPPVERVTLVDLDPEMTAALLDAPDLAAAQSRALSRPAGARRQRRRVRLARPDHDIVRLRDRRLSGPVELLARQAVHDDVLRMLSQHLAPDGVVRGAEPRRRSSRASRSGASSRPSSRRAGGGSVPRLRAVVRRMGLRPGAAGTRPSAADEPAAEDCAS